MLGERFETAQGFKVGIFERTITTFTDAFQYVAGTGFFGKGLGLGTNAAGGIMTGSRAFLVAEAEWPRVVGEVGALLGFAYIALRLAILIYLFRMSIAALNRGEPLAMLIFGMSSTLMLNSPWGAGSWMSFSILGAGLTLAAAKPQTETSVDILPLPEPVAQIRSRGRSIYAEHLHSANRKP